MRGLRWGMSGSEIWFPGENDQHGLTGGIGKQIIPLSWNGRILKRGSLGHIVALLGLWTGVEFCLEVGDQVKVWMTSRAKTSPRHPANFRV
jgi:hypothetical protein